MSWLFFQDDWALQHKVVFDGSLRKIYISANVSTIDVKVDLYSAWKEWVALRDNLKFTPALRTIGGDPIGGGQFAGDMYFLINNWQIVVDHAVTFNGVIFSDNYSTPFVIEPGGGVISKVSNLAIGYSTTGGGTTGPTAAEIRQEIDTNSTKLASISSDTSTIKSYVDTVETTLSNIQSKVNTLPTATDVASQVRTELTTELSHLMALQNGLTTSQANMLLELYRIMGLDPSKPLVVTDTYRTAGPEIQQSINSGASSTTVTRV